MSTTTEPAAPSAPTLITLTLDGPQRRAMDAHLRDELTKFVETRLSFEAITAYDVDMLPYPFRHCLDLTDTIREIDDHRLTGTPRQLQEWVTTATTEARESSELAFVHEDDSRRPRERLVALAALSAQLETAIADWEAI